MKFLGFVIFIEALGLIFITIASLLFTTVGAAAHTYCYILITAGFVCVVPATVYLIIYLIHRLAKPHEGDTLINDLHKGQKNAKTVVDDLQNKNTKLAMEIDRRNFIEQQKKEKRIALVEKRKETAAGKRKMFSRENLEPYIKKYYAAVAACFLMDRDNYKDRFGISPYNKIVVKPSNDGSTEKVSFVMAASEEKVYKFAELLPDVDSFFKNKKLFGTFSELIKDNTSMVRISEKLYVIYMQFCRDAFIKNYRKKQDFENLLILVANQYILGLLDFGYIYSSVPFDVRQHFSNTEVIEYLSKPTVFGRFKMAFKNYADLGFENVYQAYVTCFFASQKDKLPTGELIAAIVKNINKLAITLDKHI